MTIDLDAFGERCPYCQSTELIRLAESALLPVDVVRCPGCGSRFNVERVWDHAAPQDELAIVVVG
jgi:RNA polymerase subunit RPABC4/transcription elongation factor Spt4